MTYAGVRLAFDIFTNYGQIILVILVLEQFINPSIVLLKKSIKCIKTETVPRVRDGEVSVAAL